MVLASSRKCNKLRNVSKTAVASSSGIKTEKVLKKDNSPCNQIEKSEKVAQRDIVLTDDESKGTDFFPVMDWDAAQQGISFKLNGQDNFWPWRRMIETNMSAHGLMLVLTGPKPEDNPQKSAKWEQYDSFVRLWLTRSMEPHILELFIFHSSAKEMWDALHRMYSYEYRMYDLYVQIFECRQGDKRVREYYTIFMTLHDELYHHRPHTDDLEQRRKNWDEYKTAKFLHGLNPEYGRAIEALLVDNVIPSFETATAFILAWPVASESSTSENNCEASDLTTSSGSYGNSSSAYHRRAYVGHGQGNFIRRCRYCGRRNHASKRCWYKSQ